MPVAAGVGASLAFPAELLPSQNPTAFFKSEQSSGVQRVPDKLTGGPQREKIFGRPDLSKQGK